MAQKGYRQRRSKRKNENHDILGVTLIVVSLFLLLCLIIPPILSVVSEAIFSIVLGVFGIAAYPALIAVLLWGVFLMLKRSLYVTVKNAVCISLLIFFGLVILQLASTHAFLDQKYSAYIADVYAAKYSVGGVIMGTIVFGLKTAVTVPGCYVIFSLGILIVVAVMIDLVARIRARRASTAPVEIAKMPPAPTFETRTDPQNVVPVETGPGLFVGTIERRTPIKVDTLTGRTSEMDVGEKREVTDYADTPVMAEPRERDPRRDGKPQVSAAHMALYGDSEAIKKRSAEEYKRSAESEREERRAVEPRMPERTAVKADKSDYEGTVVEPYIRTAEDAKANAAAAPKKIVHESHNVFFPVEKHLVFNDDGIENADDIKRRLLEDTRKRKQSDMENIEAKPERTERPEPKRPPEVFMPIRRDEPSRARNDEPIIDADRDRAAVQPRFDMSVTSSDGKSVSERRDTPDDRFLRMIGDDKPQMPKFEPEPMRDEIINTDILRGTSFALSEEPPERSDVDPDDIIIGDETQQTDRRDSVFAQATPTAPQSEVIDAEADADIIDGTSGLKIVDGPAVDMTETHDITTDLIDGEDRSGMYEPADEPVQKPARIKKSAMPLDNQISIQSVIEQQSKETVVMPSRRRHKKYNGYNPPPIDLLKNYASNEMTEDELNRNAQILENVIGGFLKTTVKVVRIVPGPTVTRYEIECPTGVPVKQIETHSQDIEYELAALSHIRIEAPIPGKRAVGIEVPNANKSIVGIREIIESSEYIKAKSPMTFAVGKGISGDVVLCDLEKVPHLLIAGQTGSGKSACLNGLIISLLYKSSPEDLRFILVDPKRVEFSAYTGMPHLLFNNIIYEPNEVLNALKWAVSEMERRYALLAKYKCNQLSAFNKNPDVVNGNVDRLPHIIVIIDELADIMQSAVKRDIEDRIKTIAAKARAAGIHLIVATQRPSADVLTGTIKTNLTSRIAFKVSGQTDSRIILDVQGAEALVGKGDMLFFPVEYSAPKRVQGSFISDEEVASVLGYIKDNVECDFDEDAAAAVFGNGDDGLNGAESGLQKAKGDPLLPDVLALVIRTKQASTSGIQRRFSIGYARASRIMDIMEELKYIGPVTGNSKPREVYITNEQYKEMFGHDVDDN